MTATYTPDILRKLFRSSFNLTQWYTFLQYFFNATELKEEPERIIGSTSDDGYYLGNIDTTDSYRIGLFHYNITKGSVANRRIGLRNLVKSFINPTWGEFDAALVVFDSGDHWRLSFICDIKGEATSPKRYTYVFGSDDLLYRTPIERFNFLKKKGISFENLKSAFSVEALSDEFFDRYREQYADFIQYITGKRFVKVGSKWEEKRLSEPNAALMGAFDYNEKKIRDYVKKMMGRITFLHFLQRKGWICGDLNYMQNMFENSPYKNDYLDSVLEPLFFGILNTKPAERAALFADYDWDKSLLNEWKDIPYLNGGLFERDKEDEPESRFPADYFKRLFQFFSEYNFTIDENDPNDAEVGVDPEMLGKIFENLLEDNKDKGAFYTPKEIVRYMCQESLIAYLETNTSIAKDKIRQFVLSPEEGVKDIPENKKPKLLTALEEVKICDPAIGSGAFPMGLLNELLHCREVLSGDYYDRAEIKKSIIQNNIYGVDIEKGAVDIARLRFWLSIVVDEETPSPLPNLDYKIMQGNSLIESFMGVDLSKLTYEKEHKKDKGEISLFDNEKNRLQKTVSHLLLAYYSCSEHDKKVKLQQEISGTIKKQLEAQYYNSTILHELKQINLAENDKFFLWHTWFSDVFNRNDNRNGFDIVIGNPPYGANIDDLIYLYEKLYPNTSHGYKDIYKYFYNFGLSICRNSGILCYITPNTFLRQPRYGDLRRVLLNFNIAQIIDLGENIFIDAVVPVAICLCKCFAETHTVTSFADLTHIVTAQNSKEILSDIKFKNIPQEYWKTTLNNSFIEELKLFPQNIIELGSILKFKDAGINYQRVKVGLSQKGKSDLSSRLLYEGEKESSLDVEFWKGVDIDSFNISNHTSRFCRPNISLRDGERVILNKHYFSISPKLLWRQTASHPICAVDYKGIWFGRSIQAGIIKSEYTDKLSYEYLCGLLNSKYIRNIYEQNVKEGNRVFPQVKLEKLKPLPIIIPTLKERKIIEDLVNQIISLKAKNENANKIIENLDNMVDKLYRR
ncbi:BREX-1 system adenine-specific DNA-methyltransferase PglX [Parabacteroides sp. AGMB00274]|uniref:site-specific DNA-methyltransferase (adenine-specific) n=1 Tax=Parabacteroides faecalis TaxID=2924040 RepID=A0ABT0C068_9BACT|nr:TaqI-like C-terminal specificity domain-containing protein [Parabacteroides faecalis]MCI7286235.1 BREX-1 system adenine-specific DNA-methyltransferase PglX [Parabacteroides sp.]MCJ2380396.1 BREX-1 system adenine-specific DNA-methyltransferase PglX [Parabacteroides faecalis]MDY6254323.1 TaqI-like C-terminal specificity domain-containing protein [Bacteroidales bacterium]